MTLTMNVMVTDRGSALNTPIMNAEEEDESMAYIEETWQHEFCPVATQLLRRMEAHQSLLEPLEAPG